MGTLSFAQPPNNEFDLKNWRKSVHELLVGEEHTGGKLNGDNIINMTDPGDANGTLADLTAKFNLLLAELRILQLFK